MRRTMADELAAAEAKLDPVIVAKFSTFEGTVMIDGEHGHHNHQHGTSQTQWGEDMLRHMRFVLWVAVAIAAAGGLALYFGRTSIRRH